MKYGVYTYRNFKGDFYNPPFVDKVPDEAIVQSTVRTCKLAPQEAMKAHLEESALYKLGEFDDVTGKLEVYDNPSFLEDFAKYFANNA